MIMDDEELREFMIPKLAEWKRAAGGFKRSECIGCQIAWQLIQKWFDDKERERFKDKFNICGERKDGWTR